MFALANQKPHFPTTRWLLNGQTPEGNRDVARRSGAVEEGERLTSRAIRGPKLWKHCIRRSTRTSSIPRETNTAVAFIRYQRQRFIEINSFWSLALQYYCCELPVVEGIQYQLHTAPTTCHCQCARGKHRFLPGIQNKESQELLAGDLLPPLRANIISSVVQLPLCPCAEVNHGRSQILPPPGSKHVIAQCRLPPPYHCEQ